MNKSVKFSESEIRALPLPSQEQHRKFVEHLRDVHSWYKHLPLLTGGKFVVFLAPDAGEDYPSQHPHLPYGNTIEGYRRAFGYLDYMWSAEDCPFSRDGHCSGIFETQLVIIPTELMECCEFVLYPYVSNEFYWSVHEAAIKSLHAGASHPEKAKILEWKAIAELDKDIEVSKQMLLDQKEYMISSSLQIQEIIKIEEHLSRLYQWHSGTRTCELINSDLQD